MPDCATGRVKQALARMRETEPMVHAYVHSLEELALARARALDNTSPISALHGVPFAVKEVFDVAGVETTAGCSALAGHVAKEDAAVVRRLQDAGAVLIGTQVSHELTCGLDLPATRNPWDLERYPGGSSAGAGVSVAVESAWFAIGTDAAGSVRIPAAMTGVVGFKPSSGAISKEGLMRQATAPSIDNVGIVAKDAVLASAVFDVISLPDPGDAHTLQHRPFADSTLADDVGFKGVRLAVLGENTVTALDRIYSREPDIRTNFDRACDWLGAAGAELIRLDLPSLAQAGGAVAALFASELAVAHRQLLRDAERRYDPRIREMLATALDQPPSMLRDAVQLRAQLLTEVEDGLRRAGAQALLTPTTPRVAMPLASFRPEAELGTLIPYTCGFNLTGHPAISVPNGLDRNGLPIGLQFVGRLHHDATVLHLARAFERTGVGRIDRTPPI